MSQDLEPPLGKTEDTQESDPELHLERPASLRFISFRTFWALGRPNVISNCPGKKVEPLCSAILGEAPG